MSAQSRFPPPLSSAKVWFTVSGVAAALGLAALVAVFILVRQLESELPGTEGLKQVPLDVPLRVYSADGKLMGEFGIERRKPLTYDRFPPQLIEAFLASEDDRFFDHPGFDWQGLLRAGGKLVATGEKAQGGSTITMQLARNLFLTRDKTFKRKLKEILMALRIERELNKEEILTLYLNQIYLGHRAYGAAAGALVYFGKSVDALSVSEMAVLAGLPKAPSRDNPLTAPERALERRNYVLRRMYELNMLEKADYEAALAEPIVTSEGPAADTQQEADYVSEMVRAEMVSRHGDLAYTNGYQVTTTINSQWQDAANRSLRRGLLAYDQRHGWRGATERYPGEDLGDAPALDQFLELQRPAGGLVPAVVLATKPGQLQLQTRKYGRLSLDGEALAWAQKGRKQALGRPGDVLYLAYTGDEKSPWRIAQLPQTQSALVALNPETGAIEALVGGFEFWRNKFNRAVQAQRQPGSAFKPFLYSAALEHGFTAASLINDAPIVFEEAGMGKAWRPENYNGKFYGPTRLRMALTRSQNLVSVRLLMALGVDRLIAHAEKFGLPKARMPRNYSISLGTATFSPLELAAGYGVFANGGYRVQPYFISEIRNYKGEMLEQVQPKRACDKCPPEQRAERAISAPNAFIMTSMMQDVIQRGTATAAKKLERTDLAGKTGTTNDFIDAWFAGYNARLVTVVWVGNDQLQSLGEKETGAKAALPIWTEFMGAVLGGSAPAIQPQPQGVVAVRIDPGSGQAVDSEYPDSRYEWFMTNPPNAERALASAPSAGGAGRVTAPPRSEESLQQTLENLF